jgi:hypothetical protein
MAEIAEARLVAACVEQQRPKAKTTLAFPTPSVFDPFLGKQKQ